MGTQRGRACAPSAGGRSTSGCGRSRSRTTGPWQKSKTSCCCRSLAKTFLREKQSGVLKRVPHVYCSYLSSFIPQQTTLPFCSLSSVPSLSPFFLFCFLRLQVAEGGGGGVRQQSRGAPPVERGTCLPRPLLQV